MRWFDEHMRAEFGSEFEPKILSYASISQIADRVLEPGVMAQFVREGFVSQKAFGEFLGVGESTVAGWMKTSSFPEYAKRATIAAYFAIKYRRQMEMGKKNASDPKVVQDGDTYMVVRFVEDDAGNEVGEVLANDIKSAKSARVFASALNAWRMIGEMEGFLADTVEVMDEADREPWTDLLDRVRLSRARAFRPDMLIDAKRAMDEARATLSSLAED